MKRMIRLTLAALTICTFAGIARSAAVPGEITKGSIHFVYDERGISGLTDANDPLGATIVPQAPPLAPGGAQAAGARGARGAGARAAAGAGGRGGRGGGGGAVARR